MSHPNARLTVPGRRLLVARVRAGRPVAHVADEMGISRTTAHKWIRGRRIAGDAGLYDHPRRPLTTPDSPQRTSCAGWTGPPARSSGGTWFAAPGTGQRLLLQPPDRAAWHRHDGHLFRGSARQAQG